MGRDVSGLAMVKVGDVITADMLNAITAAINRNTRGVSEPREIDAENSINRGMDAETSDSIASGVIYVEISRETSTVQVLDQNEENYAEIDRIDQVIFQNENGDNITLVFNNV